MDEVWNRQSPKMYYRHLKWFGGTCGLLILRPFHTSCYCDITVAPKNSETCWTVTQPPTTDTSHNLFFPPLCGCWFSHLLWDYSGYFSLCLLVDDTQRETHLKHLDEVAFDLACISRGFLFSPTLPPPDSSELLLRLLEMLWWRDRADQHVCLCLFYNICIHSIMTDFCTRTIAQTCYRV